MSIVLWTLLFLWGFWALYVLIMGLYRAHLNKKLSRISYVLGMPWLVIGLIVDFVANVTIASLVFLDPPKELLVTARLQRYNTQSIRTWRSEWANWICTNLLDVFDPNGDHC